MQKNKSLKLGGVFNLIKCALIGIVASLIGTVIFAVVLKFANLSSAFISHINNLIKVFSIFIMITCVKKQSGEKLLLRAIVAGIIYSLLSFVIFSVLNGGFNFDITLLYDLLFSLIVSVIVTIIINLLTRKNS